MFGLVAAFRGLRLVGEGLLERPKRKGVDGWSELFCRSQLVEAGIVEEGGDYAPHEHLQRLVSRLADRLDDLGFSAVRAGARFLQGEAFTKVVEWVKQNPAALQDDGIEVDEFIQNISLETGHGLSK